MRLTTILVAVALILAVALPARADVLCASASGSVKVRVACTASEHQLNPAALGLVGPKGDPGPTGPAGAILTVYGTTACPPDFSLLHSGKAYAFTSPSYAWADAAHTAACWRAAPSNIGANLQYFEVGDCAVCMKQ